MKKQAGFTLVEIAIVLVIIGLLLGGVLKGQELINSAKVKNMVNDFRTVSSFVYSYQDRFKVFPGDQTQDQLNAAFGAGVATAATGGKTGNARLDGDWNATSAADETYVFWQHVRLANLATGSISFSGADAGTYMPRNADGGVIGVESGLDTDGAAKPYIKDMRGSFYVCSQGILGRYAKQIDITMDDGNTATGNVRVATLTSFTRNTTPAVETSAINEGQQYTVCAAF